MQVAAVRPAKTEFDSYYGKYISLVPDMDVLTALEQQLQETQSLLRSVSPEHAMFRYEAGKWSVKELVGHVNDAERIFCYRALRIARGDQTPLAGFEQDGYIKPGGFDQRSIASLAIEFEYIRRASLSLFRNLDADAWERRGKASNAEVSVRALAYIIAGHELHHRRILRDKYGLGI